MPLLRSSFLTLSPPPLLPLRRLPSPPPPSPSLPTILLSSSKNRNPKLKSQKPNSESEITKSSSTSSKSEEEPPPQFPSTIPKKPRRGRRSEAAAVEDLVRASLQRTFDSIRAQDSVLLASKSQILKQESKSTEQEFQEEELKEKEEEMVVEDEDEDWPADVEVGWGVRASEYFEKHPIKNVVGDDGSEIDWEGEIDEGWVKEINCLEWESFAFHPSPLVVLVFERYNRAADNWKLLKELEKAAKVYWNAKDRLPPRTVKIDINIEKDLAYALRVTEGPQILFVRGNKILYREKDVRTADELVQMIAHFYYNAKRPAWIDPSAVAPIF